MTIIYGFCKIIKTQRAVNRVPSIAFPCPTSSPRASTGTFERIPKRNQNNSKFQDKHGHAGGSRTELHRKPTGLHHQTPQLAVLRLGRQRRHRRPRNRKERDLERRLGRREGRYGGHHGKVPTYTLYFLQIIFSSKIIICM